MYRLGIDIGGTKVNIGLLDDKKNIVVKHAIKLPVERDYRAVLSLIKNTLDDIMADKKIRADEIISCGIGVPGTVSADKRVALLVPNIGWVNATVADEFEALTWIPTELIQDSRASALGEYLAGNGQGKKIVVCVTIGTGIGTGIIMNGKIFGGALGGAGELGHVPVVPGGRVCGCGQRGCVEKYAAGGGLDITAVELLGEGHSAEDIFKNAQSGNAVALAVLDEAVRYLGNVMVSMINLISPDCLLFSGGVSSRQELFVTPLIKYIREHGYSISSGAELYIGTAKLGADAPMVGAALFPSVPRSSALTCVPKISASIMCADLLKLESELREIEDAGIEYLHFDVMDGHFVPNLMLPMEMISKLRKGTRLAFDIHLMTEKPENIIPKLDLRAGDIVSVHWESTPHVQRALTLIKEAGAVPALAINPSTPIEFVRESLEDIGMVLLMTVNPGFSGQKLVGHSFDKIKRMREYLNGLGYNNMPIQVDGNCSFENVSKMYKAGASIFVVGTSSVFNGKTSIADATKRLRASLVE